MASSSLGRGLVEHLRATGTPLLTTFFVPALIADRAGDLPPTTRVVRRLIAYGVAKANLLRRPARLDGDGIFRRGGFRSLPQQGLYEIAATFSSTV